MIQLTPIVSRAKSKWYKSKKVKKLVLNSQLLTVQILANDVQVLILCLSYFLHNLIEPKVIFQTLKKRPQGRLTSLDTQN